MHNVVSENYGTNLDNTIIYFRYDNVGTVQTIVAPGSNSFGILIYQYSLHAVPTQGIRLVAKTSAPTGFNDANCINIAIGLNNSIGGNYNKSDVVLPSRIPANYGLYNIPLNAGLNSLCAVQYKVF